MTTAISICSLALAKVSVPAIQSFDEPTKQAKWCATLYAPTRDALLAEHYWNFTEKDISLTRSSETPSDPKYIYTFLKPADAIRIVSVKNSYGYPVDYDYSNNKFYSNTDRLIATCNMKVHETEFPDWFVELLALRLAWGLSEPLKSNGSLSDRNEKAFRNYFEKSKQIDATETKPFQLVSEENSSVLKARRGGGW